MDPKNNAAQSGEREKQLKKFKVLWPLAQLSSGVNKSFYSTYASYLYTDVYMFSVTLSGTLTLIQTIIGWIGGPLLGTFLDSFSFKKSKYWPWIVIGVLVTFTSWILLYSLKALGVATENTSGFAFALCIIAAVFAPVLNTPFSATYPRLSQDPKDRQYLALTQKIGRDGGKTLFGYIVPAMLLGLTASSGEANAYAITALIIGILTFIGYIAYAIFGLRGSYVEADAVAQNRTTNGERKKGIPITTMVKCIFTNKATLGMFLFMALHKGYYFIWTSGATYIFKYVFNDFSKLSVFFTAFNLTAIIGAMFGPLWTKLFKETKRAFVMCMITHVALLVITAVLFRSISVNIYLLLFGAGSFFAGMLENYILPMFASASDYGEWKDGTRLDGLTMSVYMLTITTGTMIATIIRTNIMNAINYDSLKGILEAGGSVPAEMVSGFTNLFTLVPVILGALSLLCLIFLVPLTDDRMEIIHSDLKNNLTRATSQHKF